MRGGNSLALAELERDVDIVYQLLIASVEAMAMAALHDFQPAEEQMVQTKKSVLDLARAFGLPEVKARALALEACKGIPWANRKFIKFLVDYTNDRLWEKETTFSKFPKASCP